MAAEAPSAPSGGPPKGPAPGPGLPKKKGGPGNAKTGKETGMLKMVPMSEDDDDAEDVGAAPKSATQFFAIPKSKKASPSLPPGSAPAIGGAAPTATNRSLPPGAAPPMGGGAPAALPGTPPPGPGGFGGPPPGGMPGGMGGPMAISGPIAAGPTASSGSRSPFEVGAPPDAGSADPETRARSFRIYAIVLALFFLFFMTTVIAVAALVITTRAGEDDTEKPVAKVEKVERESVKKKSKGGGGDTGAALPPPPPPPPPKAAAPRSSGGSKSTASAPSSSAPSAPAPRASSGPGPITIKVGGGKWTGVEVTCPSGARQRGAFNGDSSTVPSIPKEDCELHFKGGPPAKFRPVSGGNTYNCNFNSNVMQCSR